ncbi:Pentatricopeptide repeat-containing protein At1g80270, mitochondrial [Linum grandiflorum]
MWALRRASSSLRLQGLRLGTCRAGIVKLESFCGQVEPKTNILDAPQVVGRTSMFHHAVNASSKFSSGMRGLSSQAGTDTSSSESSSDDDAFSELEGPASEKSVVEGNEDELVSDPEIADEDDEVDEELQLLDTETDPSEKQLTRKRASSELFNTIVSNQSLSVEDVLSKWVEQGKDLEKSEINSAMVNFRRRRMYAKALQLSEWLETNKKLDFVERDYASRVDLIAKVRGLQKAESYIATIPQSFRGEIIYRTLLANCVIASNVKKAEEVFNKMRDLEFEMTAFACNQLLLLYKRLDKKKIADVLLLMEKENVKPTLFTYKLLIDTKGQSNDIAGMDVIINTMKAEGLEPDLSTQAVIAKHYSFGGLNEKAETILKEMEGGNLKANRWVCRVLLPLYANMGNADEVSRIWKFCESNPGLEECVAAVEAFGKLKRIDDAEAVFNKMEAKWKKLSSRHYSSLLRVYANNNMLAKGKDLVRKMGDKGCRVGPLTWDALVKLYVEAGEVEKADSMLHKAVQQNKMKPMFNSYITIMDQYSKRGDVHNAEKIFFKMRQAGYVARLRQFQALVQTYVNAKLPAYGIRERMKADNIFPNKALAAQLAQVDAFRRTTVSDLLD